MSALFKPAQVQIQHAQEVLGADFRAITSYHSIVFLGGKLIDRAIINIAHSTLGEARQIGRFGIGLI